MVFPTRLCIHRLRVYISRKREASHYKGGGSKSNAKVANRFYDDDQDLPKKKGFHGEAGGHVDAHARQAPTYKHSAAAARASSKQLRAPVSRTSGLRTTFFSGGTGCIVHRTAGVIRAERRKFRPVARLLRPEARPDFEALKELADLVLATTCIFARAGLSNLTVLPAKLPAGPGSIHS